MSRWQSSNFAMVRHDSPAEQVMGVLLIKCPNTGRELSTGIQLDANSLGLLPNVVSEVKCPHCRTTHSWRPRDARFVDAIPPSDWVEN